MEEKVYADLIEKLKQKDIRGFIQEIKDKNEMDIAEFLTELPDDKITIVFRMLPKEIAAEVFACLDIEKQEKIITSITDKEIEYIIEELYVDDAVDMLEELPANVVKKVMRNAKSDTRKLINQFLTYPENSAGSIMTAEFVDLKKNMTVRESFERIRKIGEDKETIYTCYVTAADRKLEGVVTVKELLLSPYETVIEQLMDKNLIFAHTTDDQEDVIELFSKYDLLSIPVVDKEDRLVGIITVDDIMDVMEQEATEDFEKMAAITPSEKPYLKTGVFTLAKNRVISLMLLMISATFTGDILMRFEEAFSVVPLLVALMPMLTDTGGNAGSQSSTMIIRGMAVGDIEIRDIFKVVWKELRVSLIVGFILAIVNFLRVIIMYPESTAVAFVVSISLFATVILAKTIGCTLPMLTKACRLDPAIMASPIITTVVDACALTIYFSIAVAVLHL